MNTSHSKFSISKINRKKLDSICKKFGTLFLGVTGGIATGKTTVTKALEEFGIPVIDFDILARNVVQPGMPALNEIIEYFGPHFLQEDGNIDRKKLSSIVFRDEEKRKKLEGFIYPWISEEFITQARDTVAKGENRIIQVSVPLLIETGLQDFFHRILVVYIPRNMQIERLIKRENISKDHAENILNNQLSIDEKLKYADFIIDNKGSRLETKKQVKKLYVKLQHLPGSCSMP